MAMRYSHAMVACHNNFHFNATLNRDDVLRHRELPTCLRLLLLCLPMLAGDVETNDVVTTRGAIMLLKRYVVKF